jgi:tetratricopeptide (TPR) repeat protein
MKNFFRTIILTMFASIVLTTPTYSQASNCGDTDYACKVAVAAKQIQADSKNSEAYFDRAFAYRHLDQYEQAIADYTKYIESSPKKEFLADGYHERGLSYEALGNSVKALADYNMAVQFFPNSSELIDRGNYYFKHDLGAKAISDYNQAIALDVKAVEAYYNRSRAYRAQKLYSKAIADLDVYITLNQAKPTYLADGYQNRSLNYLDLNDLVQALKDINSAIELDDSVAKRFVNRSVIYRKQGKFALAEADEKTAADMKDNKR